MLEEVTVPRLVVAGLGSGAGKTSISLGLVAALQSRGRTVQTFKVGPDFIDCAYLAHASRRPSWLASTEPAPTDKRSGGRWAIRIWSSRRLPPAWRSHRNTTRQVPSWLRRQAAR